MSDAVKGRLPSDADLAAIIASQRYAVRPEIEPLHGSNHSVFRLRFADGCKILKLGKRHDADSTRKERMLIEFLGQHGIPVPIIEHDGSDWDLAGRSFLIMQEAGDQTVYDWLAEQGAGAEALFAEMGSVLAHVHAIDLTEASDLGRYLQASTDARAFVAELHRWCDWLAEQELLPREEAVRFKALRLPDPEGGSLCHSDFHSVQCIVRDGHIAAVVDWESAWVGNPAIDFAITHAYLDFYCPAPLKRAFLAGYASEGTLPEDYRNGYLPVRMAHALALTRAWHEQGTAAWRYCIERGKVARALRLFRAYAALIAGGRSDPSD